jgi:pimeloyl-ACP methyl ester carboxylesterase
MFQDVREQQAAMQRACSVRGSVDTARADATAAVVVLLRSGDPQGASRSWLIVDYVVLRPKDHFEFAVGPGAYRAAAFDDANADLIYQLGEGFVALDANTAFECIEGNHNNRWALSIPRTPREKLDRDVDVASQVAAPIDARAQTLGQVTAVGDVVSLSDARFDLAVAESGLRRPYDFIYKVHPGVYFLDAYSPEKTPVLFVHGINGSPAQFDFLIDRLDRERFQPWVYSYPSGAQLDASADLLQQAIAKLQLRYHFERFIVVAHSMGGLISRAFVQRYAGTARAKAPLFVTISTPWGGHAAAQMGINYAPAVVDVWRDMAPGSAFLSDLFASKLPDGTSHHLIFTFGRNPSSFGISDDETVSVASQLHAAAQAEATHVYGVDDTHTGVLRNDSVAALLNTLLARQAANTSAALSIERKELR